MNEAVESVKLVYETREFINKKSDEFQQILEHAAYDIGEQVIKIAGNAYQNTKIEFGDDSQNYSEDQDLLSLII